jgi:hypothetical protein
LVWRWAIEGKVPNNEEEQSVNADEWDGSVEIPGSVHIKPTRRRRSSRWDAVGSEEDGHGSEKLAKVGAADDDLLVRRILENRFGEDVGNVVLEITMSEQSKRISRDEPAEFAVS